MIGKLVKILLYACSLALFGASLFIALKPQKAYAITYNGNYLLCGGVPCGCLTFAPPYNCYWS